MTWIIAAPQTRPATRDAAHEFPLQDTRTGGPDDTFGGMGSGDPRGRIACDRGVRRDGTTEVLLHTRIRSHYDLRPGVGRTALPAESNLGHGIRTRNGNAPCLR